MPMISYGKFMSIFGFRKIWNTHNDDSFSYNDYMNDWKKNYTGLEIIS